MYGVRQHQFCFIKITSFANCCRNFHCIICCHLLVHVCQDREYYNAGMKPKSHYQHNQLCQLLQEFSLHNLYCHLCWYNIGNITVQVCSLTPSDLTQACCMSRLLSLMLAAVFVGSLVTVAEGSRLFPSCHLTALSSFPSGVIQERQRARRGNSLLL